jgi:2'-5' RNA ligase
VKLFLGVPVGAPLASAAGSLSRQLQQRASAQAPHARIVWVPPDRFHLTVLFVGHVTESQLTDIRGCLAAPFERAPFELSVQGAGAFPPQGRPRVLWAGCGVGRDAFVELQRDAYARVAAAMPLEPEREATPHLTLARVKEPSGLRAAALLAGLESIALGTIAVDAVTLYESRPVRHGVEYVPLMDMPLQPR